MKRGVYEYSGVGACLHIRMGTPADRGVSRPLLNVRRDRGSELVCLGSAVCAAVMAADSVRSSGAWQRMTPPSRVYACPVAAFCTMVREDRWCLPRQAPD